MGDLIDPPATALGAEGWRLLDPCAPVVAAHSERSYQFAAAFAAADGVELDDEVLYLGTMLHDIGLSPAADGSERFEVRGANLSCGHCCSITGWSATGSRTSGTACDARHHPARPPQEPRDPLPEPRHRARRARLGRRSARTRADPRGAPALAAARLPTEFEAVLADEVRAHPDSVRMSWLESVASVHVPGFVPTDFLAGLRASERFA